MAKKHNPQDLTLRNLRALKKTVAALTARVVTLEQQVLGLTNPSASAPPTDA
jgi:hypothetical protein